MSVVVCLLILAACYLITFAFIKQPIRKRDIIDKVIKDIEKGDIHSTCALFYRYLDKYHVKYEKIQDVFPLFTLEIAREKAHGNEDYLPFWWDPNNKADRLTFLKWLREQYVGSQQDLRDTKK